MSSTQGVTSLKFKIWHAINPRGDKFEILIMIMPHIQLRTRHVINSRGDKYKIQDLTCHQPKGWQVWNINHGLTCLSSNSGFDMYSLIAHSLTCLSSNSGFDMSSLIAHGLTCLSSNSGFDMSLASNCLKNSFSADDRILVEVLRVCVIGCGSGLTTIPAKIMLPAKKWWRALHL